MRSIHLRHVDGAGVHEYRVANSPPIGASSTGLAASKPTIDAKVYPAGYFHEGLLDATTGVPVATAYAAQALSLAKVQHGTFVAMGVLGALSGFTGEMATNMAATGRRDTVRTVALTMGISALVLGAASVWALFRARSRRRDAINAYNDIRRQRQHVNWSGNAGRGDHIGRQGSIAHAW